MKEDAEFRKYFFPFCFIFLNERDNRKDPSYGKGLEERKIEDSGIGRIAVTALLRRQEWRRWCVQVEGLGFYFLIKIVYI